MKHATQGAPVALLFLALTTSPAIAQDAEQKPGFFRQLGKSLHDAGRQAVGLPANATGSTSSAAGSVALYNPLTGAGRINGLFKAEDHQQAQLGRLEWPRVALTFKEWGSSLQCWTVEARIWTNATASTTETFQACADAPLTITDDLGETAELNHAARIKATTDLMVGLRVRLNKPNTGDQRTTGPNPPREPFNVRVSRGDVALQARKVALSAAWVSGFLRAEDLNPGPGGLLTPFRDTRMWIAGFDADGNRDK
ncbi:hypothetical protein [Luteimonas sp. TWI1416]|uniref:hypothetical protein n=1 Tax=unclassified Luteimonas TaxID=2629088 RepID=UPI00320ACDBF